MGQGMSYRVKLLIYIMPVIIAGMITVGVFGYVSINGLIQEELSKSMLVSTGETAATINTWLTGQKLEPEAIASTPIAKNINTDFGAVDAMNISRHKFLNEKYAGIFQDVYAANHEGEYHTVLKNGNDYSFFIGNVKTRDYFQSIMNGGPTQITAPMVSRTTGLPTIFIVAPIKSDQNVPQGLVGAGISLQYVQKMVNDIKFGKTGYAFLIAKDGTYIQHPNQEFIMKKKISEREEEELRNLGGHMMAGEEGIVRYTMDNVKKLAFYQPIPATGWSIATVVSEGEFFAPATSMIKSLSLVIVVVMLLVGAMIWFVARKMTSPLRDLVGYAQNISNGNLGVREMQVGSQDEIGQLASAFNQMTQNLRILVQRISETTQQVVTSSKGLTLAAEQSTQASNQVAISITGVADSAHEQLEAANESSAVVEQMSAGIQHVADNTSQVAERSAQAAEKAKDGGRSIEKAVDQMTHIEETVNDSAAVVAKLGERSQEIGQIVDAISGIAGQTNLLALNAAIEAARAGEQGRGFAVVAEEVRKLAEQSQDAAKQIADLIGEIQAETNKAVSAMDAGTHEVKIGAEVVQTAGMAFQEIVGHVSQVSDQVREISASIQQMAGGSQQIVQSVRKIDTLSKSSAGEAENVSAATEEQLASMEEIASASQALTQLAQNLQSEVAKFRLSE